MVTTFDTRHIAIETTQLHLTLKSTSNSNQLRSRPRVQPQSLFNQKSALNHHFELGTKDPAMRFVRPYNVFAPTTLSWANKYRTGSGSDRVLPKVAFT